MKKSHQLFKESSQPQQSAATVLVDEDGADSFAFEHWQPRHVINWLKGGFTCFSFRCVGCLGIDDSISAFIKVFTQNRVDGRSLAALTDEKLFRLGIKKEKLRRQILHGIDLLSYYVSLCLFRQPLTFRWTKSSRRMRRNWR